MYIIKVNTYDLQNLLSEEELNVLHQIYLHRCLTLKQIYNNFLKDLMNFGDFLKKEKEWLDYGVIEEVSFNDENLALFLTKLGIDTVVAKYDLPKNIATDSNSKIKDGYYRPADLKMLPKAIPHQVHLNQFVLDFKRLYELCGLTEEWSYFDEKYMSMYTKIRPDGLIRFLDTDFFLEEDMNTENKNQLITKWEHYKSFLASFEYQKTSQKIIVLFIIDNTKQIENRKNLIKLTAYDTLFNSISDKFDIVVSTREALMKMLFHIFIPNILENNKRRKNLELLLQKQGFLVDNGELLKENLSNKVYQYYVRKVDENNNLIMENNRFQEFLVDYYYPDSLTFVDKITLFNSSVSSFRFKYKRPISYIIVCDNINYLNKELKLFNLKYHENIFFTTLDRLNQYPLYQALCKFDISDRLYCFTDSSLTTRDYDINKRKE